MPSFLDSMQQKADQVKFELDRRNRIGAVQHQIDDLRRQISTTVNQIGTQAIDLHRQNQLAVPMLESLCQIALEREAQIAAFQAQIDAIRAEVMPTAAAYPPAPYPSSMVCANCHQPLATNARFCPNCGQVVAVAPPPPPAYESGPACPSCGVLTVKGAAFCNECGYSLAALASPAAVQVSLPLSLAHTPEPSETPEQTAPPSASLAIEAQAQPPVNETVASARSIELPPRAESDLPFCPNCGARQRRVDARFCPTCGFTIALPAAAAPVVQEPIDESLP